ncbi:hypothetical protein ABT072_44070 [Streptomyces sp. NPDC002589]|uniref:hypothetical protein n=1 Tax=Streptomyces sp. NPDC002589 TaxID=3154420 RepID=UPI003320C64E
MKHYFYWWRDDATGQVIHDLLRWQIRDKKGRSADPRMVMLDAESLNAAAGTTGRTGCGWHDYGDLPVPPMSGSKRITRSGSHIRSGRVAATSVTAAERQRGAQT